MKNNIFSHDSCSNIGIEKYPVPRIAIQFISDQPKKDEPTKTMPPRIFFAIKLPSISSSVTEEPIGIKGR